MSWLTHVALCLTSCVTHTDPADWYNTSAGSPEVNPVSGYPYGFFREPLPGVKTAHGTVCGSAPWLLPAHCVQQVPLMAFPSQPTSGHPDSLSCFLP